MAGFVQKLKDMWTPPDDEYEYEDYEEEIEEEEEEEPVYSRRDDRMDSQREAPRGSVSGNKVVSIHANAQFQVVLSKPEHFGDETCAVADELQKMHTVVLNLEKTDREVARRILDFISGAAYANNGKVKKIATNTYIITPCNVDLTGDDVLDGLESNGVYL